MNIGQFIRSRRVELGLTQAELGARIGTTQGKVGDWERGDSSPAFSSLVSLAGVLGPITITGLELTDEVSDAK